MRRLEQARDIRPDGRNLRLQFRRQHVLDTILRKIDERLDMRSHTGICKHFAQMPDLGQNLRHK